MGECKFCNGRGLIEKTDEIDLPIHGAGGNEVICPYCDSKPEHIRSTYTNWQTCVVCPIIKAFVTISTCKKCDYFGGYSDKSWYNVICRGEDVNL